MESKIENIYIFGVGAAGSNIFLNLLHAYPGLNFTVLDFDKVEDRNIFPGTQPYIKADLNRPKTQAIQRIAQVSKQKKIKAVNTKVVSKKDIKDFVGDVKTTLLIDCFDNAKSRNLFLGLKHHVVHVGFSASLTGEVVWDDTFEPMEESKSDNEIDVCEMAIARPFIMGLTSIGSIVISDFIDNGKKTNVYFDKYLNIKKYN